MRQKIFPGNISWLLIYPANLRRLAIIFFFVRVVTVKSLYTQWLSSGYNDLLNSENLKVAIAQLCHDIEVCNFTIYDKSADIKINTDSGLILQENLLVA